MRGEFKTGDHVSWNSEAGRVSGIIRKTISAPIEFKGYTVRASREEPQYVIESDKTDHLAVHKGVCAAQGTRPRGNTDDVEKTAQQARQRLLTRRCTCWPRRLASSIGLGSATT